eukprot:3405349-Amphidinium_carterae.1
MGGLNFRVKRGGACCLQRCVYRVHESSGRLQQNISNHGLRREDDEESQARADLTETCSLKTRGARVKAPPNLLDQAPQNY